jgi:hypothetical protein
MVHRAHPVAPVELAAMELVVQPEIQVVQVVLVHPVVLVELAAMAV